jgi:ornithine carbamoyltransferase
MRDLLKGGFLAHRSSKSFPGHLLSPFQFNTLISSGSEKAGQVKVTDEVLDGPHSLVLEEAENRLHVQKSILLHCLTPRG